MNNTALGAENKKEQTINFISEAHEKFYYEKLKEVRYQDVYHKALCYCLGISDDTRRNVDSIYDFKTGCVKTECLHEGWQTSGSMKVVRMAFNLYCNGTPSVDDYTKTVEQVNECRQYTVEDLYQHLLDKWKFCWIVDKAKVNGTEEFEDYEPSLTKKQRAERDKALAHFEAAFRQIQTE